MPELAPVTTATWPCMQGCEDLMSIYWPLCLHCRNQNITLAPAGVNNLGAASPALTGVEPRQSVTSRGPRRRCVADPVGLVSSATGVDGCAWPGRPSQLLGDP